MDTKKCTTCKESLSLSQFEGEMKTCTPCRASMREWRAKPENKQRKKELDTEYRKDPDKKKRKAEMDKKRLENPEKKELMKKKRDEPENKEAKKKYDDGNVQSCCGECNHQRGEKTKTEFLFMNWRKANNSHNVIIPPNILPCLRAVTKRV